MPVSPHLAHDLAQETVELYTDAERRLLTLIARHINRGMGSPDWAERKLMAVQLLRQHALAVLAELEQDATGTIGRAIVTAYNRGGAAAVADLANTLGGDWGALSDPIGSPAARAAVHRLILETVRRTTATHHRILRSTLDGYRDVIARSTGPLLIGVDTRRQAAQRALDEFANRGVTGFIDRAGRGWDLASYVEMAVRTASGQATVDAHTDRLQQYGQDLVIVSNAPQECSLCRPWEGQVLSLTGATIGTVDGGRGVRVTATLGAARLAGLFHPNCRHSVSLYQPGITEPPTDTADPQGDADRQHLRYLERQVRSWKRREAVALDDRAAATATAKVRGYQARIREHVATTSAKRQRPRERISAAR